MDPGSVQVGDALGARFHRNKAKSIQKNERINGPDKGAVPALDPDTPKPKMRREELNTVLATVSPQKSRQDAICTNFSLAQLSSAEQAPNVISVDSGGGPGIAARNGTAGWVEGVVRSSVTGWLQRRGNQSFVAKI